MKVTTTKVPACSAKDFPVIRMMMPMKTSIRQPFQRLFSSLFVLPALHWSMGHRAIATVQAPGLTECSVAVQLTVG